MRDTEEGYDSSSDYETSSDSEEGTKGNPTHVRRKVFTHVAFLSLCIIVGYFSLHSTGLGRSAVGNHVSSSSISGVVVGSAASGRTLGSLFQDRAQRNLLVVPYCALANRLTIMIESLSISAESGRTSILNWLVTEKEPAQFGDMFDIKRSPFSSIYENADLPDSINPSTFSEAVMGSQRPLILSERDIPWLSSTVKNQPKSFLSRQTEFFRQRMWNRKHHEEDDRLQKKSGSGLIYAGCHNLSPDDLGFLKEIWPEDINSAISASQRHVEQAMYLFSSVKADILEEVARFSAILDTYRRQHDLPLTVGVHISKSNSPLLSDSSWKQTEEQLDVYKDRALFYVASNDNNVISWFCSKYKHVVAFDTEERTGGVKIEEDDMAEGKGHQVASLIELLNLGSTDFVVGNMENGFALLGRWLSDQNIVRNVLKQQKMAGRIKRKSGISIWEQDFNQCSFKVDRE
ncbi:hypothetical protein TrLO_g7436 [Triparma laevis f. longispina]|uniref:Uncharacterized protein n=1 Tax=Triparma laevis f. longispina TaxID=1714387 RepID=A0A9W6ZJ55_9STRA|nr:hypothetical protein TrLO_g7436 [Triparma laevis f. longispina]